jgi:multidrug transporter EmrE-like cation transporter
MKLKVGNFDLLPLFFGLIMGIIDVFMMSSLKMVHNKSLSSRIGIPFSIGVYALQPLIFLKALDYESMVIMNLVWDLSSDILVTLQGVLVFGESFKGLKLLGVVLSFISLALMTYTD